MRSDSCSSIISPVSEWKNVLITAILKELVTSFDVILPSNPISPTLVNLTQQLWLLAWKLDPATSQIHHMALLSNTPVSICLSFIVFIGVNEVFWKGWYQFFCPAFIANSPTDSVTDFMLCDLSGTSLYRSHMAIFKKSLPLMLVCCTYYFSVKQRKCF